MRVHSILFAIILLFIIYPQSNYFLAEDRIADSEHEEDIDEEISEEDSEDNLIKDKKDRKKNKKDKNLRFPDEENIILELD